MSAAARRGDVFLVALEPTVGTEIRKTGPCLVVSPDELNQRLRTLIVAPMTTGGSFLPVSRCVPFSKAGRLCRPRSVAHGRYRAPGSEVGETKLDSALGCARDPAGDVRRVGSRLLDGSAVKTRRLFQNVENGPRDRAASRSW